MKEVCAAGIFGHGMSHGRNEGPAPRHRCARGEIHNRDIVGGAGKEVDIS